MWFSLCLSYLGSIELFGSHLNIFLQTWEVFGSCFCLVYLSPLLLDSHKVDINWLLTGFLRILSCLNSLSSSSGLDRSCILAPQMHRASILFWSICRWGGECIYCYSLSHLLCYLFFLLLGLFRFLLYMHIVYQLFFWYMYFMLYIVHHEKR